MRQMIFKLNLQPINTCPVGKAVTLMTGKGLLTQDWSKPRQPLLCALKTSNKSLTHGDTKLNKRVEKLTGLLGDAKEELEKAGKSAPSEHHHEIVETAKKFLWEHHFCLV